MKPNWNKSICTSKIRYKTVLRHKGEDIDQKPQIFHICDNSNMSSDQWHFNPTARMALRTLHILICNIVSLQ